VEYDAGLGRVTGVRVIDRVTKAARTYSARMVFLNASSINTSAILLNSVSDAFPRGLANGSDQVGRNLMDHVSTRPIVGRWPGFQDEPDPGERPTGIYIPRYANVTETDKPYLRGFGMQGGAVRTRRSEAPGGMPWSMSLMPFGEVLPNPDNRVTLSASRRDSWGVPVPIIDAAHGRNEYLMMREAAHDAWRMLKAAGCVDLNPWEEAAEQVTPPGDRIHEMGTARMGRDPKTSVLNAYNQIHACKNVYVTDGAAMTSAACVNPSLTYMALTARAADHAVNALKRGEL
jgi:choline dehydrogenase-like flavoprotein